MNQRLSLREAREQGRLDDFIRQEEVRGTGPADCTRLQTLLREASKPAQSPDQTSHSACDDGSSGT